MWRATIRFESFELDLETGELRKDGSPVKLSPKPSRALALMAKAPGRLVTREVFRKELWDSDTHVDFEHALNFCIREIRTALGDDAKNPRYIETLARRGYRFVAEPLEGRRAVSGQPACSNTWEPQSSRVEGETHTNGGDLSEPVSGSDASDATRQIEAYRYYESARKGLGESGKEALENARRNFTRAIEILPNYALAHSGLGAACALCSLNRRHPEDLEAAEHHLTRALELDPELAEPSPWLCYVRMRRNHFAAAVEAGLRGVQLQPDLVSAHYFLGLAYFAGAEVDASHFQSAARHLSDAGRINPQWQPTWYVLSHLALLIGDYANAECFARRLQELGARPKGTPFIGAEIILGSVKLRQGDATRAREFLLGFLAKVPESDHMYRDAMAVAACCALGEVELRYGSTAAASAAFRRGWHSLQEHPRVVAYQRFAARAQAGLAAAYAAAGERSRAAELLEHAFQMAYDSESMDYNAAGAAMPEVWWTIGAAWARLGNCSRAIEALHSAVRTGWRDAAWLERDPEFAALAEIAAFRDLLGFVRDWPGVVFEERGA